MQKLSEAGIIARIEAGRQFEASLAGGALSIRVREYVPYICVAPRSGHGMPAELERKCRLEADERLLLEEPFTDALIDAFPVTLTTGESPLACDPTLPPDSAIPRTLGEKALWRTPLTPRQARNQLARHARFYRILEALGKELERRFGGFLIFEVRSTEALARPPKPFGHDHRRCTGRPPENRDGGSQDTGRRNGDARPPAPPVPRGREPQTGEPPGRKSMDRQSPEGKTAPRIIAPRPEEAPPVFGIGLSGNDPASSGPLADVIERRLRDTELPNLDTTVGRIDAGKNPGYLAAFATRKLPGARVIRLAVKRIFMDGSTGEPFPLVIEILQQALQQAVLDAAALFGKRLDTPPIRRADLVPAGPEPAVLRVDRALFRLARGVDTLQYVNPVNIQQEKKRFLSRRGYVPVFRYRQLKIDPYAFREKLYKLPVSKIRDPLLRGIYRAVVDSYATKIEMLTHVGTPQFHYNSLRYYGEPSPADIGNARFLLHAPELPGEADPPRDIDAEKARALFREAAAELGLSCKVKISTKIVAKAMVDNARRTLLINRNARMTATEVKALVHHELGVHMLTTVNAGNQPLRFLGLGLPGNTYTQEGLAILGEYLSGNLTLGRLKILALRVLAVDMMVKGMAFGTVFGRLRSDHGLSGDDAFNITVRAFRGGGFTKDYLYLKGFRDMAALYRQRPLSALFTGKTSSLFIDSIEELIERKLLEPPEHMPPAFASPPSLNRPVLDYLVRAIR